VPGCQKLSNTVADPTICLSHCLSVARFITESIKRINVKIWENIAAMSITGCSIMASSQIQDGGRPLFPLTRKSLCRHISVTMKHGTAKWLSQTWFEQNSHFKLKMAEGRHIGTHHIGHN